MGVVTNRTPSKPSRVLEYDPDSKASVIAAFGQLLQAAQSFPDVTGEESIITGAPMMIVQVLALDPEVIYQVGKLREDEASADKRVAERAAAALDDFERNGVTMGHRYAVSCVHKVGELHGAPLVVFTAADIVAEIDYSDEPEGSTTGARQS